MHLRINGLVFLLVASTVLGWAALQTSPGRIEAAGLQDSIRLLPAVTGPFATGRMVFYWIDTTRPELETKTPDDRRKLVVFLFYPAVRGSDARGSAYIPDVDLLEGEWPAERVGRLSRSLNASPADALVIDSRGPLPVLLFAPGGGQKVLAYTALLEDLASHGFVVAAIEPPYNTPAMRLPDGRVLGRLPAAERGWDEPKTRDDAPKIYERMVLHWVADLSFTLNQLAALNARPGAFHRRLDLRRVGAFGHSRGGQAAGTARLLDTRVAAAVNLDGNIRGRGFQPVKGKDGGSAPFMWIEKWTPSLTNEQLEQMSFPRALYEEFLAEGPRPMRSVRGGSAHVTINVEGITHLDFSDSELWDLSLGAESRAARLEILDLTRRYLRAFFVGAIKGNWEDFCMLANGSPGAGRVAVQTFGPLLSRP